MLANLSNDWSNISSTLNYPINFSEEDQARHQNANKCDICNSKNLIKLIVRKPSLTFITLKKIIVLEHFVQFVD